MFERRGQDGGLRVGVFMRGKTWVELRVVGS